MERGNGWGGEREEDVGGGMHNAALDEWSTARGILGNKWERGRKMKARDRTERMKISSEMQIRRGDRLSSIVRVSCLQGTANYNLSSYSVGQ